MSPLERDLEGRPGEWEFDAAVAADFGSMLSGSIPEIDRLRRDVFLLGTEFIRDDREPEWVIDLGASTGDSIAPIVELYPDRTVGILAVERAPAMVAALETRFGRETNVVIAERDLREGLPRIADRPTSLVLSVLTLQFVPVNYRLGLVSEIYDRLRPGGAFVLVEKVLGASASIDSLFVKLHEDRKAASYDETEIARKKLALEGVLVPLTAAWNETLLETAGFTRYDCFWRSLNFAGWVAVK